MDSTLSQASFWEDTALKYAAGSNTDTAVQFLQQAFSPAQNAISLIQEINYKGYGTIGSAALNVTLNDIDDIMDKQTKLYDFCCDIHDELLEKIDAPFAKDMGVLAEDLYAINPNNITVTKDGFLWFDKELSLYDLILPCIDDEQLKTDFEANNEALQDVPCDNFNSAMLSILTIVIRTQDYDNLSDNDKNLFAKYYQLIYPRSPHKIENVILDAINTRAENIGEGIYANSQVHDPYKNYIFDKGNFAANGCMAMAIYNSNITLGRYSDFSTIESEIVENKATFLNGHLGGKPDYISDYYTAAGYKVEQIPFPSQTTMEQAVQDGDTCILMFAWYNPTGAKQDGSLEDNVGAHFVSLQYDNSQNTGASYLIYNLDIQNTEHQVPNLSCLSYQNNSYPLVMYKISKEP